LPVTIEKIPDGQDEGGIDSSDPPAFSTHTKGSLNLDANHASSNARGKINGFQSNALMQSNKEPENKSKYQGLITILLGRGSQEIRANLKTQI
jgi:hypothetical protein